MPVPFHISFHVTDLDAARSFYGQVLGCREGRSAETWVDFDFFGHQLSVHLGVPTMTSNTGKVGEHLVPMPHFGVIVDVATFRSLADRLIKADLAFVLTPGVRFAGTPGEQYTMFFRDPAGNAIEIKAFTTPTGVFTP